jgi:hypothetical protein
MLALRGEDEEEPPPFLCLALIPWGLMLGGLGISGFHILAIYALVAQHTEEVFAACGHSLWNFVLVHLLLPCVFLCMLCCTLLCMYVLLSTHTLDPTLRTSTYFAVVLGAALYYAVLVGVGAYFAQASTRDAACLKEAGLLGSVAWAYVAWDALSLAATLCLLGGLTFVEYYLP